MATNLNDFIEKKECVDCHESKELGDFVKDRGSRKNFCKPCQRIRRKAYYSVPENLERFRQSQRRTRSSNREKYNAQNREYRQKQRQTVLVHYGGVCVCCGDSTPEFLALDHKNNDGYVWRKATKNRNLAHWAAVHGFPDDLQLMCHNCNMAKSLYKACPHQLKSPAYAA